MATNRQVRAALAGTLAGFGAAWNIEDRPPESVTGRSLVIGGIEWEEVTLDAERTTTVSVFVVVPRKNRMFINELDEVTDPGEPTSVPALINADPTLGGVVDYCVVRSAGDYRDLEIGGQSHYAATITCEVGC